MAGRGGGHFRSCVGSGSGERPEAGEHWTRWATGQEDTSMRLPMQWHISKPKPLVLRLLTMRKGRGRKERSELGIAWDTGMVKVGHELWTRVVSGGGGRLTVGDQQFL